MLTSVTVNNLYWSVFKVPWFCCQSEAWFPVVDNPVDNSCKLIYVFRYSGRAKSLHFRSAKVTNINFSRYNTNKPSKEGVMRINEITAKGKNIFFELFSNCLNEFFKDKWDQSQREFACGHARIGDLLIGFNKLSQFRNIKIAASNRRTQEKYRRDIGSTGERTKTDCILVNLKNSDSLFQIDQGQIKKLYLNKSRNSSSLVSYLGVYCMY